MSKHDENLRLKKEKAFKPYVMKMETGKGVYEQTIYLADASELEKERDARPNLDNVVTTAQLVEALNKDETLGRVFKEAAVEHGAQVFPVPTPPKKSLLSKLKGLFQ